jgi:integrase
MGRPPLPVGSFGRIDFHRDGSGRVRARACFRDFDGLRRPVTRWGATATEAELRLRTALADRAGPSTGELTPSTRVSVAAALWLAEVDASVRAAGTKRLYRAVVRGYVTPSLGGLHLGELRVAVIERALAAICVRRGPGAARTARCALSGICAVAVRHGALRFNPIRDTAPISYPRKPVRALSVAEAADLLAGLRADARAVRLDLPDFVEFMLGTGMRIGEAAAVRDQVLDLTACTVRVDATVVRVLAVGLRIQPHTKTPASRRTLALPEHLIALLRDRAVGGHDRGPYGVVFPSPKRMLRDPSNTQAGLRSALDRLGYGWVTSHTFRKTVATRLDEAGMSARQIADQLGHARPSMTLDVYPDSLITNASTRAPKTVGPAGLEPATYGLKVRSSNQLS